MPAEPKVGDIYWSEDIPGVVFEQATVRSTTGTIDGPEVRSKAPPWSRRCSWTAPPRTRPSSPAAARFPGQDKGRAGDGRPGPADRRCRHCPLPKAGRPVRQRPGGPPAAVDATAKDRPAVASDVAVLGVFRDRIGHTADPSAAAGVRAGRAAQGGRGQGPRGGAATIPALRNALDQGMRTIIWHGPDRRVRIGWPSGP
jgi:hypothetical protein